MKGSEEGGVSMQPSVKDLLEDANKMLVSQVMERLQKQLNSLRQKTFRISTDEVEEG